MLTNSLQTKWVAQFFICIYLLLITSTGNAFFWCKDAETDLHLESNLGGKCWTPCFSESEEHRPAEQPSGPGVDFSSGMGGCLDSPTYSSAATSSNKNRIKNKTTAANTNTHHQFSVPKQHLGTGNGYSPCVHQRPPRQTLAALRTVVLLH